MIEKKLIFLRHGSTIDSQDWGKKNDTQLDEAGVLQIRKKWEILKALWLSGNNTMLFYCSEEGWEIARARQTAEIIIDKIRIGAAGIYSLEKWLNPSDKENPEIILRDLGKWEDSASYIAEFLSKRIKTFSKTIKYLVFIVHRSSFSWIQAYLEKEIFLKHDTLQNGDLYLYDITNNYSFEKRKVQSSIINPNDLSALGNLMGERFDLIDFENSLFNALKLEDWSDSNPQIPFDILEGNIQSLLDAKMGKDDSDFDQLRKIWKFRVFLEIEEIQKLNSISWAFGLPLTALDFKKLIFHSWENKKALTVLRRNFLQLSKSQKHALLKQLTNSFTADLHSSLIELNVSYENFNLVYRKSNDKFIREKWRRWIEMPRFSSWNTLSECLDAIEKWASLVISWPRWSGKTSFQAFFAQELIIEFGLKISLADARILDDCLSLDEIYSYLNDLYDDGTDIICLDWVDWINDENIRHLLVWSLRRLQTEGKRYILSWSENFTKQLGWNCVFNVKLNGVSAYDYLNKREFTEHEVRNLKVFNKLGLLKWNNPFLLSINASLAKEIRNEDSKEIYLRIISEALVHLDKGNSQKRYSRNLIARRRQLEIDISIILTYWFSLLSWINSEEALSKLREVWMDKAWIFSDEAVPYFIHQDMWEYTCALYIANNPEVASEIRLQRSLDRTYHFQERMLARICLILSFELKDVETSRKIGEILSEHVSRDHSRRVNKESSIPDKKNLSFVQLWLLLLKIWKDRDRDNWKRDRNKHSPIRKRQYSENRIKKWM